MIPWFVYMFMSPARVVVDESSIRPAVQGACVLPPGGEPPRTPMPLAAKKVKPSRRAVRSNKLDEESALQELARRVVDEAPARASVACPAREFVQLPLSDNTLAGLSKAGFSHMTEIQRTSIPHALAGRDLQGGARTGSGKTLAFIVPMLECLYRARWSRMDGLGGLVISPTRELALQIFDVLRVVGSSHIFSAGLVIGGKDVQSEQELISTMNILVATPGRLLQHMDETPGFDCSSLLILILDEADRMLDLGFEKTMNAIVDNLPKRRQTLLFSATLTKSVKALARLSLSRDAEVIGVHDTAKPKMQGAATTATGDAEGQFDMPRKLSHSYMVCELDKKLNVLYSFAKTHLNSKMIVFLSSCKQTKFYYEAIRRARPGLSVMCMHGRMKQMKRMAAYCRFCEDSTKGSMLLATDVAARGLDFPSIDWVLQLDCPEDVATYIHRSGRTARYRSSGRSLLFLLPSEREAMLAKLTTEANIVPRQVSMNAGKSFDLQESLAGWVAADPELKFLAQKAFVTFVRSYYLQKDKEVFDVGALPLEAYASALGLPGAPRIRLVKKSKPKSKLAPTATGAAASDMDSGTESEEEDVDAPAPGSRPVRTDNVAKLMQRKNVGVLNPTRASLREDDSSGDESDDLMQIKRRDHDLPGRSEDGAMHGSDVDAAAAQKAELKKMSRKQRRIAKQVARGEVPRDSGAHKMRDGDTSIEGWKDAATTYAAEVRDRVAAQDTGDKGREKDRVRAKHRAERAARRAFQAEREGLRGAGEIEGGYRVELGSPSDDDTASGEVSDRSRSDDDEDSEGSVAAGGTRTVGKRKQQTEPVDSDSDVEAESHSKRHQIASPGDSVDLQAIAAQLLRSRSLI